MRIRIKAGQFSVESREITPNNVSRIPKRRAALWLGFIGDTVMEFNGPLEAIAFAEQILLLFPVSKARK